MSPIKLTHTISGKMAPIDIKSNQTITLYVCGITPYDHAHVGHGRCYVTFDVLYRLLRSTGNEVRYCRNFTDIDDKLLNRSEREYNTPFRYQEVAKRYIASFHEDMQALNCISPTYEPLVTQHIEPIITFVQDLVAKNHAYVVNGDVYFSIDSFPAYGSISGRDLSELRAGARVAVDTNKKNPLDFALWKSEAEGTFWKSPWGWGRPGWHIECSALANEYLGNPIDIHGGGMDLIFPHHENEYAQSAARFGPPFVKHWVHNAFVRINQEKMSKSLGNFFTLKQVFEQFSPQLIRYYYLQHHYRSPLDFAHDEIVAAQKSYKRLVSLCSAVPAAPLSRTHEVTELLPLTKNMLTFLYNDLNTPGMFGVLFEHYDIIATNPALCAQVKMVLQHILGLTLEPLPEKTVAITTEIQKLIDEREQARREKNWKRADELREILKKEGVDVQDKKSPS